MSKFCFRIISLSSLESELSFDSKDSEISFDRARSTTQCELTQSLLRALRAICNISSDDGEDLFADELLVYYEWIARYEVEEQANEKLAGKKTQGLLWMVNSTPKHKVPTSVYSPFTGISVYSCR